MRERPEGVGCGGALLAMVVVLATWVLFAWLMVTMIEWAARHV